ncbi:MULTISPECIES: flagellin [Halomonadaceae]|uniref:flagellin N-terminal helical domain-containing protein n=1 Tax=Halomonadaceae TaxID=28256 RepID=UPI0015821507|nr:MULTISPECIES: flagellin [Halomonas]NUJ58817.1 flagellin FliC [Halomonas taeanensis]
MSVINTNITSMIGQQNLNESKNALTTSMERLSSGLRINSAKDDAAGQAIANRMSSQITGLSQAQRNANDGISVAQTAEGALNQVNDNLQRIRELSVQAQNGTNNQEDLTSIQNEINQRLGEIDRISEETSFNGTKVLDSDQELSIQVGANDGESISISLSQINAETLGLSNFNVDGQAEIENTAATEDDLKVAANVSVSTGSGDYTLEQSNTAATASDVLSQLSSGDTVDVTSGGAITDATQFGLASGTISGGSATLTSDGSGSFSLPDVTAFSGSDAAALATGTAEAPTSATYTFSGGSQDVLIDSTGNITDTDGNQLYLTGNDELTLNDGGSGSAAASATNVTAAISADANAAGNIKLAIDGGPTIESNGAADSDATLSGVTVTSDELTTLAADNSNTIETTVQTSGTAENINIQSDGSVVEDSSGDAVYVSADDGSTLVDTDTTDTELFVRENGNITDNAANQYFVDESGSLTTEATSPGTKTEDPLQALDSALSDVDALRSDLGAIQNRFDSAITNLSTTETNLSAARSRIEDADYATEVADMTRAQILQQAGTSVLAQANQIPQGVLSLLG